MNLFALTSDELAGAMKERYGKGMHHASAIYREIFKGGNTALAGVVELSRSPSLAARIGEDLRLPSCRIIEKQEDEGVVKFAAALADGQVIESVVIPAKGRTTLCVSSQVGCRMGCRFCATGGMGFLRDLAAEEMVWQVYAARFLLRARIDRIVFMGMGEPLDNLDHVAQAIRVMNDQRGFDIALSRITVSTSGHADGIRNLAALNLRRLRLAVSLNAARDELRSRLMPINDRYPLAELKKELISFPPGRDGVIFIEYVLLQGINDDREDARELACYLQGIPVRVNVIAFNRAGSAVFAPPDPSKVHAFCGWLADEGLFVRLRRPRGKQIMAACGQLGAKR